MTEAGPEGAGWNQARPDAVSGAASWLRAYGATYTREVLDEHLRQAGYRDVEIEAAWVQFTAPAGRDLRPRAAGYLLVGFVATWGLLAFLLVRDDHGYGALAAMILAGVLLPILGLSLVGVGMSDRLRRGVEGALAAILTLPFVLLVIVAGLCVATTGNVITQ
jgi:hypothetical protein